RPVFVESQTGMDHGPWSNHPAIRVAVLGRAPHLRSRAGAPRDLGVQQYPGRGPRHVRLCRSYRFRRFRAHPLDGARRANLAQLAAGAHEVAPSSHSPNQSVQLYMSDAIVDLRHVYIEDLLEYAGQDVLLKGWLYNRRESKTLQFLVVRDGTGLAQCVVARDA